MSSYRPVRLGSETGLPSHQVVKKARRAQADQAFEVYRYGLGAHARAQIDQHDSHAVADASQAALDVEMDLLDYGLARAGASAAKVELVARHVQRLATINDRRITHRFGG